MSDLLSKMAIPFEPKRNNRFIIRFPSSIGIHEWSVESASRPSMDINAVEIPFMNTSTWVAGRFKWKPINVVIRDTIGPSGTQAVMEWVRQHAESVTGRMGYAVNYKKTIEIDMLDPVGVVVEKWQLVGCELTGIDTGSLKYNDDGIATISMSIQPDTCIHLY